MDLNLLKTLISVAESKNFQEAAQRLGISQPAVSFQLKQLEAHLPVPIFFLSGKRKVLTHYGQALYAMAKQNVDQFSKSLEKLDRQYSSASELTLRVGGRLEILEFISASLSFPGRIELISTSSPEAIRRLLAHEIDIAISYQRPDSAEIIAKKLFQSSAFLVIHKQLLKRRALDLPLASNIEFLRETPAIVYQSSGHILQDWVRHCGVPYEELNVRYVVEDWRLVKTLVDRGKGYALIPQYVSDFSPEVVRIELPARILPAYTFYAIFERGLKKIKAFREVLEFEEFAKIQLRN